MGLGVGVSFPMLCRSTHQHPRTPSGWLKGEEGQQKVTAVCMCVC